MQPMVIIYAPAVAPALLCSRDKIVAGLRPITQFSDDEFTEMLAGVARIRGRWELVDVRVIKY